MEPLYTTQTAYTFDEYKKYNKKILLNKLLLIFILFIAVITLLFILSKSSIFLILMLLYIIILAVVLPILINWNLKKYFMQIDICRRMVYTHIRFTKIILKLKQTVRLLNLIMKIFFQLLNQKPIST